MFVILKTAPGSRTLRARRPSRRGR